jgi:hypothetical protein
VCLGLAFTAAQREASRPRPVQATAPAPQKVVAAATLRPTATVKPSSTTAPTAVPTAVPTLPARMYLGDIPPRSTSLGFGVYSVGRYQFTSDDPGDHITAGDPLKIGGLEYPHGIFAHAPSRLVYALPAGSHYQVLTATIGMVQGINCGDGVLFVILLDGKEKYRSATLHPISKPVKVTLLTIDAHEITLVVETGPQNNKGCDWAIWGDPLLE